MISYIRRDGTGRTVVIAVNFAGVPHEGYRLGLPSGGAWDEVINTDADVYGGWGVGNLGLVEATAQPLHAQGFSASVRLPSLGAIVLVPEGQ